MDSIALLGFERHALQRRAVAHGLLTVSGDHTHQNGNKDDDVEEDMHVPGVVWQVHPHLSPWLEYVYWSRDTAGDDDIIDRT